MQKSTSKRWPRVRRGAIVMLLLGAGGLVILHQRYPLPYVWTVLAYREPDFTDIHEFPSRIIAAPDAASVLPVALDPDTVGLIAQHPKVDDLDTLITSTDTTAFLVVHDGVVVIEKYAGGHDQTSMQNTFSVSKSFMSSLVGFAVEEAVIDLDAPITEYVPELIERDAQFADISVAHLLNMRSGIRYSSDIGFPIINCDDPLIYYSTDLESVILERTEIESPPGEFQYNNYNPPLIGLILRRTTGMSPGKYLQEKLWQPMGAARNAGWTTDQQGFERMESGFYASGRDLARFGLLYLNRGAGAAQVVPETWVARTTDPSEPFVTDTYNGRAWGYHFGWWIVPRPDGQPDFSAIGRDGQFIYVSPQYKTVIVRTGPGRGEWGDRDWTELFYFIAEKL